MRSPRINRNTKFALAALACLLAVLVGSGLISQEKKPAETDAADKDYAAELPRIPATEAKDAVKTFTVAKGFKMDLVAAEPLVTDPIALAIDENLRMFVVEMNDGGLYGNGQALRTILKMQDDERRAGRPVSLVFNGDFNWFNVDARGFREINETVLQHIAIQGNVEAEIGAPSENGCGCNYPDYVDSAIVALASPAGRLTAAVPEAVAARVASAGACAPTATGVGVG